jgi:hypothetical protein
MPRLRPLAMMGGMVNDLRLIDKRVRTVASDGRCCRLGCRYAHGSVTNHCADAFHACLTDCGIDMEALFTLSLLTPYIASAVTP